MEFYFSEKKKLRGWKRRKKEIERWKENAIELDVDYVKKNHKDYVKLWINPFYGLIRRTPPIWYKRLLLEAMIEVYLEWNKKMKEQDEPFYLKLWLDETEFINSQIVVAYKTEKECYEKAMEKQDVEREFPIKEFETVKEKLEMFDWELYSNDAHYLGLDLEEWISEGLMTEEDVKKLLKNTRKKEKDTLKGEEVTVYTVKIGDVWVGTLKEEQK